MKSLLLALMLGSATATAHEIEGSWTFEKEVSTRADGTLAAVPPAEYDGLIIYTKDGHVSATIMPRGRRWTLDKVTLPELMKSVGEGAASAYAGTYTIDDATHTVVHMPMVSVDPADMGTKLVRHYEVVGDTLKLSGKWTYQGEELTFTVFWKRAR